MERLIKSSGRFYLLSFLIHVLIAFGFLGYASFFVRSNVVSPLAYSIEVVEADAPSKSLSKNLKSAREKFQKNQYESPQPQSGMGRVQDNNKSQMRNMHGGITPPKLLQHVQIPYPEVAYKNKINGRISTLLTIDRSGQVIEVQLESSSDRFFSEEHVLSSLRHLKFIPAQMAGEAVESKIRYVHRFELEK